MKILLDENIDVRFKKSFSGNYAAFTVKDMEWKGIKNGQLLLLLKEHDFDEWIEVDKNIPYQQNVANFTCLIIVLNVYRNTLRYGVPLIPQILEILQRN